MATKKQSIAALVAAVTAALALGAPLASAAPSTNVTASSAPASSIDIGDLDW